MEERMPITVYDNAFNVNEWFILISLVVGFTVVWLCPKRFPVKEGILFMLYGMFTGKFFDHTISISPFDFYDVNDTSAYQFIDFVSYIMFAPYSYFFVYLYEQLQIKRLMVPLYILFWCAIAIGIEYFALLLGVYHYKNGYKIFYSIPIYLSTQSILLWILHRIRVNYK
jgi:hypothetical protein